MKLSKITSCYVSPGISTEQFIPEHFFLYLVAGTMTAYDGSREYKIKAGDYGIARKNHLAKYNKQPDNGKFEKIVIFFDEEFLRSFNKQYSYPAAKSKDTRAVIELAKNALIENCIQSLKPYYNERGEIDKDLFDVKRSELLLLLLKQEPAVANFFFDFGKPGKINIEEFMNRNYRFNVNVERFAYLTGRSLSAFKRDFVQVFSTTPSRWLLEKRLQEAHFLIKKKNRSPSDVYLDLGFENLSHFSFAFKKMYGFSPSKVAGG
ncbi:MAG TPA: AraC family transcriptional regulator [Chryseolinea sp.]|nr:AraC family transcriptional regulator [Chryseolinea sp.]